ncbi:MAG TPA: ferritin [Bacteroidales bacterium]|nr:ferritin [Bacteroidales bacterium]HSA44510.1 ferritin [Bacteroidales bacterium]
MKSKNVEKAINEQIVVEAYSSQLYLAMASWCEKQGFAGASRFLYMHSDEERMHMLKLVHYLNDRGGHAIVPALKAPPKEYKDIFKVFEDIMEHEEYVTASINKLLEVTMKEKDYNTANFLQWFVMEQVEEESVFRGILDKISLLGKEKGMFFLIDKELDGMAAAPVA